ncbi:MAG: hypothetical protein R2709_13520 [Marmoricola sp.]
MRSGDRHLWSSLAAPTSTRVAAQARRTRSAHERRGRVSGRHHQWCCGLNPSWTPGTPVLIRDHINLTATSPIEGANFIDLTDLYSTRLRALCREVDPALDEGATWHLSARTTKLLPKYGWLAPSVATWSA